MASRGAALLKALAPVTLILIAPPAFARASEAAHPVPAGRTESPEALGLAGPAPWTAPALSGPSGDGSPPSITSAGTGGESPPSVTSAGTGGESPPSVTSASTGGESPPSVTSTSSGGASPSVAFASTGGERPPSVSSEDLTEDPVDPAGWADPESNPDALPSTWLAEPRSPEPFQRPISLTEVELPPVTPGLQALQAQLDALPLEIQRSPATEFGFILTDLAAAGLFFGSVGVLTAVDENEQVLYALLTAASAVMLPIGAITWAVGEIIDGSRRRALKRRRHQLMRAIDEERAFLGHG